VRHARAPDGADVWPGDGREPGDAEIGQKADGVDRDDQAVTGVDKAQGFRSLRDGLSGVY
jgi:hypothetical protein